MKDNDNNSVFSDNYAEKTKANNELNGEIKTIINNEIDKYIQRAGEKPTLLDIGCAGLYLYNPANIRKITMLDLFCKPGNVELTPNTEWFIGNILSLDSKKDLPNEQYDFIIMSSLLHHLCNSNNKIKENLFIAFQNCRHLLKKEGKILIFESTCPRIFCQIEDIIYPVYSFILVKIFKFTFVRMTCVQEIFQCLKDNSFSTSLIHIRQPKFICMLFLKIPLLFTPLKIQSIFAGLK
jgi:SAM-dependent methyltransferase